MRLTLLALLTAFSALHAQTSDAWKKLDFVLGRWEGVAGEKDTPLGGGQGSYSFTPELNAKIIVRRNNAQYNSGVQHDDLMVIYLEDTPRAIYFDSEGHVIRYNLAFPAANRLVFESDGSQPGPRYRLTYWLEGASLNGQFEVGAPGKDYQSYMKWKSTKR
jgi:hypothetical protein